LLLVPMRTMSCCGITFGYPLQVRLDGPLY
jgi:hypothetical protein